MTIDIDIRGDQFFDQITGRNLQLAGNHWWNNVQPINGRTVGLDHLTGNFTRLWTIETREANFSSSPWGSNTPGLQRIEDGPFKKDGSLNGNYYRRMEKVVRQANRRGVVAGVTLFEGSIQRIFPGGWEHHPFNGLGPTRHEDIHSKGPWNRFQRAHVKRLVKVLEPYGNVIFEVGNELASGSIKWFQGKAVKWVQKRSDQPVGVSYASGVYRDQSWMGKVGADFIVPGNGARAGGVARVRGFGGPQVLDTDHAWPLHSNVAGLHEAWRQGRPIWIMDGLDGSVLRNQDSLSADRAFIDSVL